MLIIAYLHIIDRPFLARTGVIMGTYFRATTYAPDGHNLAHTPVKVYNSGRNRGGPESLMVHVPPAIQNRLRLFYPISKVCTHDRSETLRTTLPLEQQDAPAP